MDLRKCSREILSELITLYESLPCLWQVKNKDYSDRNKKADAYDALITKYKEIEPTCTRETVAKKINNLRTVYRKESEKVRRSAASGCAADRIYRPRLWYYDKLHFLRDQDTPRVSKHTMEDSEMILTVKEEQLEDIQEEDVDTKDTLSFEMPTSQCDMRTNKSECDMFSPSASRSNSMSWKRKRETNDDATTEVIKLLGRTLQSLENEDGFQTFGKYVASKLRSVSGEQSVIAQKLMSDVLFEAEMGSLTRKFRVVEYTSEQNVSSQLGTCFKTFQPNE
ncbi:uncharacterized protein LOC128279076 [Anopheles cruzii]|uniref:uncharacterized protein LOC128279076 n=1 Tax=Anopheles cruzii TaxID=68878 RepID=UPI0022EC29B0|nr:uncharacterized protein LOC128279076 [Anopheles cruzii]